MIMQGACQKKDWLAVSVIRKLGPAIFAAKMTEAEGAIVMHAVTSLADSGGSSIRYVSAAR